MSLTNKTSEQVSHWLHRGLSGKVFDRHIFTKYRHYLFQTGLATAALIVMLLVEDAVLNAAIVVAVASSAFIVFVVPNSVASTPRKVIGGHLVAVIVGTIGSGILMIPTLEAFAEQSRYLLDIVAALSVGLSILVMVATNTEHPPAAGTVLGLVVQGLGWQAVAFILVSAVSLSLIRLILRPKLINLL